MCKNVDWDQVLNVGNRPKLCGSVEERKKERVELDFEVAEDKGGSGMPMSSPEAVLGGPCPVRICVRWDCGIV
jgi:hypothetical protein